jgi:hypothetical protein
MAGKLTALSSRAAVPLTPASRARGSCGRSSALLRSREKNIAGHGLSRDAHVVPAHPVAGCNDRARDAGSKAAHSGGNYTNSSRKYDPGTRRRRPSGRLQRFWVPTGPMPISLVVIVRVAGVYTTARARLHKGPSRWRRSALMRAVSFGSRPRGRRTGSVRLRLGPCRRSRP